MPWSFNNVMQHVTKGLSVLVVFTMMLVAVIGTLTYEVEKGVWVTDGCHNILAGKVVQTRGCYMRPKMRGSGSSDSCPLNCEESPFRSVFTSFWWVLTTVTTVGYGDVVPLSISGQILGSVAMLFGVLGIAMPIGVITTHFGEAYDIVKRNKQLQKDFDKIDTDRDGKITRDELHKYVEKRFGLTDPGHVNELWTALDKDESQYITADEFFLFDESFGILKVKAQFAVLQEIEHVDQENQPGQPERPSIVVRSRRSNSKGIKFDLSRNNTISDPSNLDIHRNLLISSKLPQSNNLPTIQEPDMTTVTANGSTQVVSGSEQVPQCPHCMMCFPRSQFDAHVASCQRRILFSDSAGTSLIAGSLAAPDPVGRNMMHSRTNSGSEMQLPMFQMPQKFADFPDGYSPSPSVEGRPAFTTENSYCHNLASIQQLLLQMRSENKELRDQMEQLVCDVDELKKLNKNDARTTRVDAGSRQGSML